MMDSSWYDQKWNSSEGRMFDNFVPMFPEDVADQIIYCCTCPRHVQISDISSYATNQSYFSMKGVPPVARMGPSLGSETYNCDGWQQWQQGWGDHWGMNSMGRGMFNSGRNSPRMWNNGGGSPFKNSYSNDYHQMGSYRSSSQHYRDMTSGDRGEHWKYNKPGYGSPYGSPRNSYNNMPHGSMA